jgi:protein-disulfide isomerase
MKKDNIKFILLVAVLSFVIFHITRNSSEKEIVNVYFPEEINIDLSGYPFRGNENGKFTIIELSSFECKNSKALQPVLDTLHAYLKGNIKHYFKPRPVYRGDILQMKSRAVLAAKFQGKYWEMKRELFTITVEKDSKNRRKILRNKIIDRAERHSLDIKKFKKDLQSKEIKRELQSAIKFYDKKGLKSVPTLFINGRIILGVRDIDYYLDVIAEIQSGC